MKLSLSTFATQILIVYNTIQILILKNTTQHSNASNNSKNISQNAKLEGYYSLGLDTSIHSCSSMAMKIFG